jgi:4-hydroxy-2-oxoheptanedioate aldolase
MNNYNYLKQKLSSGKAVIGTWSIIPSIINIDIIAESGLDFIIVDMEHGPINFETGQSLIISCESKKVSPVIRVGGVIESDILRALDIGCHCVQVPNLNNALKAKEAISYTKYPPIGNRGFSPFTRAGGYSILNAINHTSVSNNNTMLAIHVEGNEGIANIDEILKLEQIDIVFIGIFDISKSLGIPGQINNKKVIKILKELTEKIIRANKYPGSIVNNMDQLKQFIDFGIKYITYSVDCNIILESYKNISNHFKKIQNIK